MTYEEKIKKDVLNYATKTSNHLFTFSDWEEKSSQPLLTIIPFKKDGKERYAKITIIEDKVSVTLEDMYGVYLYPGTKANLRNSIFYQGFKHKSIKNFKTMRRKSEIAKKLLESDWTNENGLKDMLRNTFLN